jgi:hypothetical protein
LSYKKANEQSFSYSRRWSMKTIFSSRVQKYLAVASTFLVTVALMLGMLGCETGTASAEIWDWHDLDAIRNNLDASCLLMRNLDSGTDGYSELASETANQGRGWEPIGTQDKPFNGIFDGQGFEISDLFIGRLDTGHVGLFGFVSENGVIKNVGVVNAYVVGEFCVGGVVGINWGTLSNSYSDGTISGSDQVGGLVGGNGGSVSNCHSTGIVSGDRHAGGLVGACNGPLSNSHFTGSVSGTSRIGGLAGGIGGTTLSNSCSSGSVRGSDQVGGLVGYSYGTVSRCYSTGSVTGDSYTGGLIGFNRETISDSCSIANVTGGWLTGGLVGQNRGAVSRSYSAGAVDGDLDVGGLVGRNYEGTVSNSFWDTQTSGQSTSDGGTGKTTADMQDIITFSGAMWDINEVANPNSRDPSCVWNIVSNMTCPFLSWQP